MTNVTSTQTTPVRSEELRGRASGVIVGASFGLAWAASAISSVSSALAPAVAAVSVAIFGLLVAGARRLRRAASARREPARSYPRVPFGLVFVSEWIAIIAGVAILGDAGRSQWIPAVICAVVGLHFVPLGRMFRVPLYYATAAALCLVAATTLAISPAHAAPLWHLLPGFGAALTLWATGAGLLVSGRAFTVASYGSTQASG
jgi:hypothetical protein